MAGEKSEYDPQTLFTLANSFSFSSRLLNFHGNMRKHDRKAERDDISLDCPTFAPGVVISAFSLELYLKCLILMTTGNLPRGHTLIKLFDELPGDVQAELISGFDHYMAIAPPDQRPTEDMFGKKYPDDYYSFAKAMDAMNNAFVEWRYLHEKQGNYLIEYYGQGPLTAALEGKILSIEPTWRKIIDRSLPYPKSIIEHDPE